MWTEWSPRAFARAEAEKKPVLLSLVTAWSDECAAMDQTTFVAPDVVSLIDERFVAVRVDADRRPDVNERYNLGGWPTTAFLTSRGDLLSGGTYLDAAQMMATLQQVADAYRDRAKEIARAENSPSGRARASRSRADRFRSARQRRAIPLAPHRALRFAQRRVRDRLRSCRIPRRCSLRSLSPVTATASSQASLR